MRVERIDWDGRDASELVGRLRSLAPALSEVSGDVADILGAVRSRGDEAIRDLATRFGEPAPERLRVDPEAVEAAPGLLDPDVREALRAAAVNIAAVARAELQQISTPAIAELEQGQRVELRSEPVPYAGVYAPGGRAAYPSSLLMCAIPAQVAGVARIAVASPPAASTGRPATAVLAACAVAGVTEVYAIGGAQAIAAFAFGRPYLTSAHGHPSVLLLGGEVYHYHSKMIMKDARVGGAWAWHQDYGYWYQNGVLFPLLASAFIAVYFPSG